MRFGLIGAGFIAHAHASAYRQVPELELVAVTDLSQESARSLATDFGARVCASVDELLADPAIEAVDICTPTYEHRRLVEKAAAAGKHVLCEKPMARTVEDADAMIAACREAGVMLMVGHVMRWEATAERARQVVESGALGPIRLVRMTLGGATPNWGYQNWFADPSKSGGPFLDLVIHDFDWLLSNFGPVERVTARSLTGTVERGDYGLVLLRFKNGIIAHVEAIWNAPDGFPFEDRYEIAGLQGIYEYGEHRPPIDVWVQGEGGAGEHDAEAPLSTDAFAEEIRHFIHCCRTGETPRVTPEQAREAVRVALAAAQSAATGQPVVL